MRTIRSHRKTMPLNTGGPGKGNKTDDTADQGWELVPKTSPAQSQNEHDLSVMEKDIHRIAKFGGHSAPEKQEILGASNPRGPRLVTGAVVLSCAPETGSVPAAGGVVASQEGGACGSRTGAEIVSPCELLSARGALDSQTPKTRPPGHDPPVVAYGRMMMVILVLCLLMTATVTLSLVIAGVLMLLFLVVKAARKARDVAVRINRRGEAQSGVDTVPPPRK